MQTKIVDFIVNNKCFQIVAFVGGKNTMYKAYLDGVQVGASYSINSLKSDLKKI